ncbi:MAG: pentapeptide repeat-containing protein, partial [Thermodesulfobacteriota bacterium]
GARLRNANLSRAYLTRTDLTGADLAGADFTGAELILIRGLKVDERVVASPSRHMYGGAY